MEIELQGQISRHSSLCPGALAGSLPAFTRIQPRTNDSLGKLMPQQGALLERSIMNSPERSMTAETAAQKIEYTVKQTAKIHQEKPRDSRSSLWLSVVKCVFGSFLFVSVLACLVASKMSLLSIVSFHSNEAPAGRATLFIMVVLVLMIPEAFSFLKACWTSLFPKNHKWPCKKAIFVVSSYRRLR